MSLVVRLDRRLPATLPVGSSTAVLCAGVCYHPEYRIEQLQILVDGHSHLPAAFGMPRPDESPPQEDARGLRYHSGFWGTVQIPARERPGTIDLRLAARLANGGKVDCSLGEITVLAREAPPSRTAEPASSEPGLIAICMATFEPDLSLFETQLQSLRSQSDERWICLISDDCSSPERYERIRQTVGEDHRFAISRSELRLGFYRNFERVLAMVPAEAELVALSDQDDRWDPDKLRVLRSALGDAVLVYSDQRLVDADGKVLRDTLWKGRSNNYTSLASMLVANTITGAAAMFRRELLEVALPFPDTPGFQFHDHWLAVAALAAGDVAYVDRPMYDYVQHPGAVFGDVTHGAEAHPRAGRLSAIFRLRNTLAISTAWRAAYFYGYLARETQAQALLVRCGPLLTPRKRRVLQRFTACQDSPSALAWLASRPVRCLLGRNETLGTEIDLARGITWKWLIGVRARHLRRRGGPLADASIPPLQSFSQTRLRRWRSQL